MKSLNIALVARDGRKEELLTSTLLNNPDYEMQIPDCIANYANRKLK